MQAAWPILWWTFPHNYIVWMATRQMHGQNDSDTSLACDMDHMSNRLEVIWMTCHPRHMCVY